MPIVADFTVLNKPTVSHHTDPGSEEAQFGTEADPFIIGDDSDTNGARFAHAFSTGGAHFSHALVSFMHRGLRLGSARVAVRNRDTGVEHNIGRIRQSRTFNESKMWKHEQFVIDKTFISRSGSADRNELIIGRVPNPNDPDDDFDDFHVRDIVVFFHQAA